jgi:hypothetical protein
MNVVKRLERSSDYQMGKQARLERGRNKEGTETRDQQVCHFQALRVCEGSLSASDREGRGEKLKLCDSHYMVIFA